MAKVPSIKVLTFREFEQLSISEIESKIKTLKNQTPNAKNRELLRSAQQALRTRQQSIKLQVMQFEATNNHHLLIYKSTENYYKIAGHSVLFYSLTIADRLCRRCSVKFDTDDYAKSGDGIVSIRALEALEAQLANLGIFTDSKLSTDELHFYLLPKVYTDDQIARLRERSKKDVAHITSLVLPKSPLPELYNLILELNQKIYYNSKHGTSDFARTTLLQPVLLSAQNCVVDYLNFANNNGDLLNILLNIRYLRNVMANMENVQIFHRRNICEMLDVIIKIERIAEQQYHNRQEHERLQAAAKKPAKPVQPPLIKDVQ